MKLYSFLLAWFKTAINKRILTLTPEHIEWFVSRWHRKFYREPLIYCLAKYKSWIDIAFNDEIFNWQATFYPAGIEELRAMEEGDGLIQRGQKRVFPQWIKMLHTKLDGNPA